MKTCQPSSAQSPPQALCPSAHPLPKCGGAGGALCAKPALTSDISDCWAVTGAAPMATGLIISEPGVPALSKGEGEGRINDCLQELFRTHWHSRRKHVRQLRSRKNINIPLFIHRLLVHSSNTKVHETEQSILCLT